MHKAARISVFYVLRSMFYVLPCVLLANASAKQKRKVPKAKAPPRNMSEYTSNKGHTTHTPAKELAGRRERERRDVVGAVYFVAALDS